MKVHILSAVLYWLRTGNNKTLHSGNFLAKRRRFLGRPVQSPAFPSNWFEEISRSRTSYVTVVVVCALLISVHLHGINRAAYLLKRPRVSVLRQQRFFSEKMNHQTDPVLRFKYDCGHHAQCYLLCR